MNQERYDYLKENIHRLDVDLERGIITNKKHNGLDKNGYQKVRVYYKNYFVHQVVAFAGGLDLVGKQVNHINGVKTDNRLCNLEAVTCKENIRHAWKNGLSTVKNNGENNGNAKLTKELVITIRELHKTGKFMNKEIAEFLDLNPMCVGKIIRRERWKHIN